jgi:CHAD domain-containing protein
MQRAVPISAANEPGSRGPGLLAGSLKQQWKRYRKQLKRCQHECSPRAIHAFRVETRRLVSTLELLGGFLPSRQVEKAQRILKRHRDTFDELRDAQVQLAAVSGVRRTFPALRPFYACLREREERLTRKTRKRLTKVRTGRLGKLITGCRGEVEEQLTKCAPRKALAALMRSVDRAFRRTRQLRGRIDGSDTWTIHRTRVAFKKFRYMVETLAEHLPAITEDRLAALRQYQTMMGEIQDAEVLLATLDKFLLRQEINLGAVRRFRAELLRRRQRLIRAYLKAADQLLEFWPLPGSAAGVAPAKARRKCEPKVNRV